MTAPTYELRHGLRVPAPGDPRTAELDVRPRRIHEWLRQLPLADAQGCARQLLTLVRAANERSMDAGERWRFATTLHETVGPIARSLLQSVSHRGFPLNSKARQQAELCTDLQRALADSYKLTVAQTLDSHRGGRKFLGSTLHQAMTQSARLLLDQYTLYTPAPDGLWHDLHRLHRIAEEHELLTPASSSRRAPIGARIGELYRQCLLISLSNPYRLQRGELGRVTTLASALAHRLILSAQPTPQSLFEVRTELDRPPLPRSRDHNTGGIRYLDLTAVVEALRESVATGDERDLRLHEDLLALWQQPPRRSFKRLSQSSEIRVGVGLETAHFLLQREQPEMPEIPPVEAPALGVIPPVQSMLAPSSNWRLRHPQEADRVAFEVGDSPAAPSGHGPLPGSSLPDPHYRDHPWRTLDVSARGCCLRWNGERPVPAKVGDVVMLRETNDACWTVGTVRWMQYERDQGMKLGVEILAPGAAPVMARRTDRKPSEARPDPALELPAVQAAGQPATLIVPATTHRVGEQLDVLQHCGSPKRVRLVGELERSGSFTQFLYEPAADGSAGDSAPPAGS